MRKHFKAAVRTMERIGKLVVAPIVSAEFRIVAQAARHVARQNPQRFVEASAGDHDIPVFAADTITDIEIRAKEIQKAPNCLTVTDTSPDKIPATINSANVTLHTAVIDAIRLSRAYGNRPVEFTFKGHSIRASGRQTALVIEKTVKAKTLLLPGRVP